MTTARRSGTAAQGQTELGGSATTARVGGNKAIVAPQPVPGTGKTVATHDASPAGLEAAILDALPHPVFLLGRDNLAIYANTAAEDFLQVGANVLRRTPLTEFIPFSSPLLALIEQVWRSGISVNEYGVDLGSPRLGERKLVDIHCGRLPGALDAALLLLQHRTMAQMIERQLTHRAAARSVSGLAAVLAHEIKNPLSGIRGAAQLIEPSVDDDGRALTQLICDETERIRHLVDRMEVFGDERPIDKSPLNIHAVLDHVRRLASSGFAGHVRFIENYDPSLPLVMGNRDMLVQVLLNLVKNAAEAINENRRDGRITLTTAFRPGVRLMLPGAHARVSLPLMVSVEDNGQGVPDGMLEHLFDPFVTTRTNGTGLGLALVAKIVRDHGGIIECERLARGTMFRMLLPLHVPERGSDGGPPPDEAVVLKRQ